MSDSLPEPNPPRDAAPKSPSTRQAYNVVSDVGAGVNFRLKDNVFQGLAILGCMILGALLGLIFGGQDRLPLALVGGFVGVLVGLFGSGIFLMIYRAVCHIRGKHD